MDNLVAIMGGYFAQKAHHLNVNVMNRDTLMAAYEHPEQYPNLTIRVSGYAVNFYKLSREQQREVISRTFHEAIDFWPLAKRQEDGTHFPSGRKFVACAATLRARAGQPAVFSLLSITLFPSGRAARVKISNTF